MKLISAVITCKNEEKYIEGCLESINWVDEIIIVDNGSTDNTIEICKKYTDNIIHSDNVFTGMRVNEGINIASGDWILNIDADERLEKALTEEIKHVINRKHNIDAFHIPFKHHFMGKWLRYGGWYPSYIKRLYLKNRAKYNIVSHHVQVEADGRTSKLKNHIIHLTPDSIEKVIAKTNLYSSNMAKFSKQKRVSIWDTIIKPFWVFIKRFFLKRGYKDGIPGFIIAVLMAIVPFVDAAKLIEYTYTKKREVEIK